MSRHTKKFILEHYECEGQTDISDFLPFNDTDVDNFVTDVDNISDIEENISVRLHGRNPWIYGPHNPCCSVEECVDCSFRCYRG